MTAKTKNLLLIAVSCVVAVTMLNAYIVAYDIAFPGPRDNDIRERAATATELGVSFDKRLPLEVLEDMREGGHDVWPHFFPSFSLSEDFIIDGENFVPLSSLPEARSVFCNECGQYPIYSADRYGFHNADEVYEKKVGVALMGDSFAFGFCVMPDENIANRLRRRGINCVNFGQGGNGPLMNLAVLSEYALELKAEYYVWLCYEGNDLKDAVRESGSEVLVHYLDDPEYVQGLKEKKTELARLIRLSMDSKMAEAGKGKSFKDVFFDMLLLRSLRGRLGLSVFSDPPPQYEKGAKLLARALRAAKERVTKVGGKLIVVYLPSREAFSGTPPQRKLILDVLNKEGIPFLDMTDKFKKAADPLGFFPFRMKGHYNSEGYGLVAESLYVFLQKFQ